MPSGQNTVLVTAPQADKGETDDLLDRADAAIQESRRLRAVRRASEGPALISESRGLRAAHQILVAEAQRLRARWAGIVDGGTVVDLRLWRRAALADGHHAKPAPQPLLVERSALSASR
jgi:hypothetical protein